MPAASRPTPGTSSARRAVHRTFCLGVLLLAPACTGLVDPQTEHAAAERSVEQWVQRNPAGWALNRTADQPLARPSWSQPCTENPASGFMALRHSSRETEIDLFFRCPFDPSGSAAAYSAAFSHAVLQELPHGIESPGWRFALLTPTSSVSDGLGFSSPAPGRLRISIETPLYAIRGHSARSACEPLADGPSPEGCHLQREHAVPLSIQLVVPTSR